MIMYHPKLYTSAYDNYAVRDVISGDDDAVVLSHALTSKDMHVKLSLDPVIAEKELALRIFLDIEPSASVIGDGRGVFTVNATFMDKDMIGPSPEQIVEKAVALKEKLAPFFLEHQSMLQNPANYGKSAFMSVIDPEQGRPKLDDWESSFIRMLLICDTDSVTAWNGGLPVDRRIPRTQDDGSYKVLTDEEATAQARSVAESNIMEMISDLGQDWIDRYVKMDEAIEDQLESFNGGRGKALNPIDGSEHFENIDGTNYYIYQVS
jgi:hypothetical protein